MKYMDYLLMYTSEPQPETVAELVHSSFILHLTSCLLLATVNML